MKIHVIEDQSPFYIKITHEGIDQVFDIGKNAVQRHLDYLDNVNGLNKDGNAPRKLGHVRLRTSEENTLRELSPYGLMGSKTLFAAILSADAHHYYPAHKDGLCNRFGINYYLEVSDDKCRTNWYGDDLQKHYELFNDGPYTRELRNFNPDLHQPKKTAIFKQGDCVIINVDLFHDFDNRLSTNKRRLLSLRPENEGSIHFEDAVCSLFGTQYV